MPRSWFEAGRNVVADIKETLRLHFKHVQSYGTTDLGMDVTTVLYDFSVEINTYGGEVEGIPCISSPLPLSINSITHDLKTQIQATISGGETLDPQPVICSEAILSPLITITHPVPSLEKTPKTHQGQLGGFHISKVHGISGQQAQIPAPKRILSADFSKFLNPKTFGVKNLRFRTRSWRKPGHPFPVIRRPIPPHRFAVALRNLFRDKLAERAQLKPHQVQISHVFDRVYLGLYQSIRQATDGSLILTLKQPSELKGQSHEKKSVYWVMGHPMSNPRAPIQVIIPMDEIPS